MRAEPMHHVESAATHGSTAAVDFTLQWTSEAEINKRLQLLFATTLPLKLCHINVIVV